jgi:hypothetical protein
MLDDVTFTTLASKLIPQPYEFGSIQESDVLSYEEKLGQRLPEDYRKFLLLTNGGRASSHFVWSRDSTGKWEQNIPNTFLGINDWATLDMVGDGEFHPSGYLQIAYDPGGNPLYLNLKKNSMAYPYAAVYMLDHEESIEEGNLLYIAPSFSAYLQLMQPYNYDTESDISQLALNSVIMNDDVDKLQEILDKKLWRIDEYYRYGNTLADDALLYGKMKVFNRLVDLGAKVPRFFKYAHTHLSEDEIIAYIQSGKM